MSHKSLFIALCCLITLSSCGSSKFKSTITCFYPELPKDEYVPVFEADDDVPSNSDLLGGLLLDGGQMRSIELCDSIAVLTFLREEARKVGGNAVAVNYQHTRSLFEDHEACFDIGVNVYRVHDFDSEPLSVNPYPEGKACPTTDTFKRPMRKLATTFAFGYGSLLSKAPESESQQPRPPYPGYPNYNTNNDDSDDSDEATRDGFTANFDLAYYITPNIGLGLTYSGLYYSNEEYDSNLSFVGLALSYRYPLANDKWLLTGSLAGGGSFFFRTEPDGTDLASGLGCQLGVNLEYRFSRNVGLVAGYNYSTGGIEKEDYKIPMAEGLTKHGLNIGVRFMFD